MNSIEYREYLADIVPHLNIYELERRYMCSRTVIHTSGGNGGYGFTIWAITDTMISVSNFNVVIDISKVDFVDYLYFKAELSKLKKKTGWKDFDVDSIVALIYYAQTCYPADLNYRESKCRRMRRIQ